ncbi:polysaccharide deacetylase family protein [Litoribacter populi]|uniref:polysaccharide deacetylase family protein n=1 Tax=Litoribacter populi TaxID=2598460 RepID=UPI0011805E7E|nr:polysaccharide deacetylase family protein [Litoribacter populi]
MDSSGHFVVSLDFELYWGRFEKLGSRRADQYYQNTLDNIPRVLELFDRYGIRATWATVGMLMAENPQEWRSYMPEELPMYRQSKFSAYAWYLSHPFPSKYLFAPQQVAMIASAPGQELASHTFSHYYTCEPGQEVQQFRADLRAARKIASDKFGVELTSLVFPRNQVNFQYLPICKEEGFTCVRSNPRDWYWQDTYRENYLKKAFRTADTLFPIGGRSSFKLESLKVMDTTMPLQLPASRFFRPNHPDRGILNHWRLSRIVLEMTRAARFGETYHLWWHPHNFGHHPAENLKDLEALLNHYQFLKEHFGMESRNMGDFVGNGQKEQEGKLVTKENTCPE